MVNFKTTNRRNFLKTTGLAATALAVPAVWGANAQSKRLIVGGTGGLNTEVFKEAYYKPFLEKTGIEVIPIERRDNPAAEIRAVVETGTYKWDFCEGIAQDVADALAQTGLLEKLDLSGDTQQIPASMRDDSFIASNATGFILAYRTDKFSKPISYADMWDVKTYPGRRSLRHFGRDTIQVALVADGVSPADVSKVLADEAGWKRAFSKLDAIKPNIAVWWQNAAQTPTLLQTGEVDICPTFNARAQSVIDAGSPVAITWEGSFYNNFGWVVPKGSPKADMARELIKFCGNAQYQAAACSKLGTGPSNPNAISLIEEKRAKLLPTHPDNIRGMAPIDYKFWGPRQAEVAKRFNEWMLK